MAKHGEAFGSSSGQAVNEDRSLGSGRPEGYSFCLSLDGSNRDVPGCLHLKGSEGGEVSYDLTVKAFLQSPGAGGKIERREFRESHIIHVTPPATVGQGFQTDADGAGPSFPQDVVPVAPDVERVIRRGRGEAVLRLLLGKARIRMDESLPVGVEIRQYSGHSDAEGTASKDTPESIKGLRRVKVELWRRVRTPKLAYSNQNDFADEGSANSMNGSLQAEPSARGSPDSLQVGSWVDTDAAAREHLTLLHKSGKSCRFSTRHSVRLLFELPSMARISKTQNIPGYGTCGEITQSTPYHDTSFFVRAIAGFDGDGGEDVAVDAEITVGRAYGSVDDWDNEGVQESAPDSGGPPSFRGREDPGLSGPLDEASRRIIYRLKGLDLVGQSGTTRLSEMVEGSANAGNTSAAGEDLPSFFQALHGSQAGQDLDGPPTFAESQHHRQSGTLDVEGIERQGRIVRRGSQHPPPGADPERIDFQPQSPRSPSITGELTTWTEYDGYETFSQPPPSAEISLGSNTSMDLPQEGDDPVVVSDLSRGMINEEGITGRAMGLQDRLRLMERLGVGEGTRVFDMHGDLPPGIDEPSLPALPHALLPHHRGARQSSLTGLPNRAMDTALSPPPAFAITASPAPATNFPNMAPPPTFAASEAAEARGMVAADPRPASGSDANDSIVSTSDQVPPSSAHAAALHPPASGARTPDLPPTYEGHPGAVQAESHVAEAPPGYT